MSVILSVCPHHLYAFEDSCSEEFCEKSHVLTDQLPEQLPDHYVIEQQNKDILEKSFQGHRLDEAQKISDNAEPNSDDNKLIRSEETDENHQSSIYLETTPDQEISTDKHSEKLDVVTEFQEDKTDERMQLEGNLRHYNNIDENDVSLLSETTEDHQEDTESPQLEVIGFSNGRIKVDSEDIHGKETNDQQFPQPTSRRKYFPLFYTIRSLLTSLLSDFGDESGNQETTFNSSEIVTGNTTTTTDHLSPINATMNGTDSSRKTRFQCAVRNITSNTTGEVKIVNSTELLEILNLSKNQKVSPCVLVMFYAPWCHFCAKAAPHYNVLARAFPQLDVLAVDTSHFSYLNARFGTVAVPNLMLFHARSAVRFNHTARVLDNFIQFVTNNT
ncbi:unnamed protein product, partial [Candidula unifasciata]